MMRRLLLAVGLALAVPWAASAQDEDLVEVNAGMVSPVLGVAMVSSCLREGAD